MWKQVGPAEPLAELRLQTFRESLDDPLAILGPPLPCLLLLNDDAPDLPVRLNHGGVERLPDTTPRLDEDRASARRGSRGANRVDAASRRYGRSRRTSHAPARVLCAGKSEKHVELLQLD